MYLMISGGGYESLNVMSFTTLEELKKDVYGKSVDVTKYHTVYKVEEKWTLPELITERHIRTVSQFPTDKIVSFEAYGEKKE